MHKLPSQAELLARNPGVDFEKIERVERQLAELEKAGLSTRSEYRISQFPQSRQAADVHGALTSRLCKR